MTMQELLCIPMPELIERFRVRATRYRSLKVMGAPETIMRYERNLTGRYVRALRKRGATREQLRAWWKATLHLEDLAGRPWCNASAALLTAMRAFLDVGGTLDEIIDHAEDAQELYELDRKDGP